MALRLVNDMFLRSCSEWVFEINIADILMLGILSAWFGSVDCRMKSDADGEIIVFKYTQLSASAISFSAPRICLISQSNCYITSNQLALFSVHDS